jgi:glycine/D-amino acid oxidase-like deaminating enzyme
VQHVTCLYTNTPDYHFILDRHPAYPNIVIGSACSGHGFKFAPATGELLAALVRDEPPALPLDTFAISRFTQSAPLARRTGA